MIYLPTWGPASIIEIVWTAIAILGSAYSFYNYQEGKFDFAALPGPTRHGMLAAWTVEESDHALTILYRMLFRNEFVRLTVQTCFFLVGLISLFVYPPVPGISPVGLATIVLLVGAHVLLALASFKDSYARKRLRDALITP